ncbi:MAG TPA: SDR family NAD(P)-dependent oxidoreductase [Mycobacteriales bacterium]|nr:SDR family NAD(P)-dependent oxidoreductase [Mycobacteriales bacterium]
MKSFQGQVAVITGAASGIGRGLALELAREGARLALSDIDAAGLAQTAALARALGAEVDEQRVDVAQREQVVAYAEHVRVRFGAVHLVVNNAGIALTGDVRDMDVKDVERVLDVDFWGVVHGTMAFLPHLVDSGEGTLVNISSLFGLIAMPGQSAYNAAKFAVRGFTEALRQEVLLSGEPVTVTCVHPGGIRTSIARNATAVGGHDAQALSELFDARLARISPERAARVILAGARRGRARVLIGADAKALDLLQRLTGSGYQRLVVMAARRLMPSKRATITR